MSLTLLFNLLLCACALSAWRAAREAGVNGWLRRYALAMLCSSAAITVALVVVTPRSPFYKAVYVTMLVPILALIVVQAIVWVCYLDWRGRALVLTAASVVGGFGAWSLAERAALAWSSGVPWEIWLLIVQFPLLAGAGLAALASEAYLPQEQAGIAHLLGTMWFMQALEKAMSASGFMYIFAQWSPVNQYLPSALVAVFLYALSRQFRLVRYLRGLKASYEGVL